ncbi:ABC transporter permease [Fulvivirgaceae bacterium PWU37]|uniref:ABC transporter permease n=1 Tax=Dawidia soli TaxID=2782352 RepID=A0AAP2GIT0_9BACT|nr:ABC transporter permease [Dawidia soli]
MYKHYILVALRNMLRHQIFSGINVLGLALGMTCCLFIFLWVQDERRVDNFHANGDNLYTLYYTQTAHGETTGGYAIPYFTFSDSEKPRRDATLAEEILAEIPGIQYATPYVTSYERPWGHPMTFQVGETIHKLQGASAMSDFLKMFSFSIIAGDRETPLRDVSSIAVSRKMARMFFDSPEAAIGKSIRYEDVRDFVITAVFEDVPQQSSLQFDYLLNWEVTRTGVIEFSDNKWATYVQLQPGTDAAQVEAKVRDFLERRKPEKAEFTVTLGMQPFRNQYLVSNFVNGVPRGGRIEYVRIFTGVAIFILLIACINFMNLATARSLKRAKEVGVRKVVGSTRSHLIAQFFGESVLLSFLALACSLLIVHVLLPGFNTYTGKQIESPFDTPASWAFVIGLMMVTGLAAGSYPALFLSSLKPARILKGILRFSPGATRFRKGLTVFQFALSIILVIATLVVSQQTHYVQTRNLGYNKENLLYMHIEGELSKFEKYVAFKAQALSMPGIAMVDRSSEAPHAMGFVTAEPIHWEGQQEGEEVGFKPTSVGFDFIRLMDLKLADGRDFSRGNATDSADAFLVNEEAVRQMNMKDPLGKWVSAWQKKGHIIGILKDYHTHSLHEPIKPLIIDVKEYEYFGVIIVRTEPGKTREAIASLENLYREINPHYPFAYQFLDQEYAKLYQSEEIITRLSSTFALLAIAISCLGLLGLVMYSAEQRTKEIGIRKVLGARVSHIVGLLTTDFLMLVLIAFVVAAPVAGYFMWQWLQQFAFRIDLSWWIFALAGGLALMVACLTIAVQALRSATANPVKSLRSE